MNGQLFIKIYATYVVQANMNHNGFKLQCISLRQLKRELLALHLIIENTGNLMPIETLTIHIKKSLQCKSPP